MALRRTEKKVYSPKQLAQRYECICSDGRRYVTTFERFLKLDGAQAGVTLGQPVDRVVVEKKEVEEAPKPLSDAEVAQQEKIDKLEAKLELADAENKNLTDALADSSADTKAEKPEATEAAPAKAKTAKAKTTKAKQA